MTALFNSPGAVSLLANVVAMWAMVWLVNAPAQRLGLSFRESSERVSFAPDGGVIAAVWIVLFAAIAAARWLLATAHPSAAGLLWLTVGFAVWCAAYIYYTVGLAKLLRTRFEVLVLVANALTIVFAVALAYSCWLRAPIAGTLIAVVALWCIYAGAISVALVREPAT
jgi:tryptophan-rich sensory protein